MIVHTLTEKDGMVQIGAAVTKGEALDAGPQILRFCYAVNDQRPPIVLDHPDQKYATRASTAFGLLSTDGSTVSLAVTCDSCSNDSHRDANPAAARRIAAVMAAMADYAETTPDPQQVRVLADLIAEAGVGSYAAIVADAILRRFTIEERGV